MLYSLARARQLDSSFRGRPTPRALSPTGSVAHADCHDNLISKANHTHTNMLTLRCSQHTTDVPAPGDFGVIFYTRKGYFLYKISSFLGSGCNIRTDIFYGQRLDYVSTCILHVNRDLGARRPSAWQNATAQTTETPRRWSLRCQ
jgi:hypothetical protein